VAFSEKKNFHNPLKISPKPLHNGLIRFKITDDGSIQSLIDEIDEFLKREEFFSSTLIES
jgi:hypothetical protein